MANAERTEAAAIPAPLSFHLGYAGPRWLGPPDQPGDAWEPQLRSALQAVAGGLRQRLAASQALCLCGSLAQGADLAIVEALLPLGALLRAWLPEPLDRFGNESDFPSPRDRERLQALTRRPDVVEVSVVADAADRRERFAECAARIVHATEAMLCVRHWDAERGRGGTEETIALAEALGRPVIEVRLQREPTAAAAVTFPPGWQPRADAAPLPFARPQPRELVAAWKATASAEASRQKLHVVRAAAWTVALQLTVAIFAVCTIQMPEWEVAGLIAKTAVILTVTAIALTSARRGVAQRWAQRRLLAELQRSWHAVRGLPGAATWFEADLPPEFTRHGRDLAVLHGLDRATAAAPDLAAFRERYRRERLRGQRDYAQRTADRATRGRNLLRRVFHTCLALTLAALGTKLILRAADATAALPLLDAVASLVSILGPTFGAAAVSFVALLDLAASSQTNARLADFLALQERLFATCTDWQSVRHVVVATEQRLCTEVESWYSRHAFRK